MRESSFAAFLLLLGDVSLLLSLQVDFGSYCVQNAFIHTGLGHGEYHILFVECLDVVDLGFIFFIFIFVPDQGEFVVFQGVCTIGGAGVGDAVFGFGFHLGQGVVLVERNDRGLVLFWSKVLGLALVALGLNEFGVFDAPAADDEVFRAFGALGEAQCESGADDDRQGFNSFHVRDDLIG